MTEILMFVLFFGLVLINVPIAFSIGLTGLILLFLGRGMGAIELIPSIVYASISSFTLLAIPFFILAGVIMEYAGISKRLIDFANVCVSHRKNGIAIVTVMTALFFAAISGSGPATVAAIGGILIPALVKNGYPKPQAAGLVASSGSIGIIIPPSIAFIVYAVVASDTIPVTISRMFIAGIIPGLLFAIALVIASYFVINKKMKSEKYVASAIDEGTSGHNGANKPSFKEVIKAFYQAIWGILIPVIIIGGIYGGIFTPTEAAVVAVFYALFVGLVIYRDMSVKDLPKIFIDASVQTAVIMIIVGAASILAYVVTTENMAQNIANAMLSISDDKIVILLIVTLILLIIGCFIDAISALYLLVPILLPVVLEVGVDPTTFGVLITVSLAIGLMTPPVGLNLFVASGISNQSLKDVSIGVLPFLIASIIVLLFIAFVPALSNWLPNLLNM
ncbi:C4-dicarboxylate transporter, DctM subunit [Lentibacillus halodurans]|uniref:C4-dicarboxylate transporter, DctM subunit n=1 Tax=Lentibacillus halodurans TaxID=237679 RepID=A0A1I0VKT4_9BACI|nr:TRAP transporter large permease [Lentibacillus halodurans]SFA76176.1 C4-dicarboxylate transporter, DctM subunit [Lentibacillus halodurans]